MGEVLRMRTTGERSAEQTVRDLFEAAEASDVAKLRGCWAPDAVWNNMPAGIVRGGDAISDAWAQMLRYTGFRADLLEVAVRDDVVLTERLDHILIGDLDIPIEVSGTFVVQDGQIVENREYWDWFGVLRECVPVMPRALFTLLLGRGKGADSVTIGA